MSQLLWVANLRRNQHPLKLEHRRVTLKIEIGDTLKTRRHTNYKHAQSDKVYNLISILRRLSHVFGTHTDFISAKTRQQSQVKYMALC